MDLKKDNRREAISNIYRKLLQREPDEPGLNNYYFSDLTIDEIAEAIDLSEERQLILLREEQKFGHVSIVESWVSIGSYVENFDSNLIVENKITDILDITKKDVNVFKELKGLNITRIEIPNNVVMSISDTKKALSVVKDVYRHKGEDRCLLVCDNFGCVKAPAVVVLWYCATGLELNAAKCLVLSMANIVTIDDMLLGPWHVSAAEKFLEGN